MLHWITIFSHDLPRSLGHKAALFERIDHLAERNGQPQHPARQVLGSSPITDGRHTDPTS